MKKERLTILIPALLLSLLVGVCAAQKAMTTEEMVVEAKKSISEVTVFSWIAGNPKSTRWVTFQGH